MNHKQILQEFTDWLLLLGYAKTTVYKLPKMLLPLLQDTGVHTVQELNNKHFYKHYTFLKTRSNKRFGGGLSNKTLNQYQWGFRIFCKYLNHYYRMDIVLDFKAEKTTDNIPDFLTVAEVKELFTACKQVNNPFKQRYQAMLVLLYSCGLRRNEASILNVQDIRFDRRILCVEQGKNRKQRFVPFNHFSSDVLRDYLLDARMELSKYNSPAFLLGIQGHRLTGGTIGTNVKTLVELTGNKELQDKKVTAHTLRHSIATHLLEQDMPIENIQLFLGHSSLESTQIYTHITTEDEF